MWGIWINIGEINSFFPFTFKEQGLLFNNLDCIVSMKFLHKSRVWDNQWYTITQVMFVIYIHEVYFDIPEFVTVYFCTDVPTNGCNFRRHFHNIFFQKVV